MKANKAPEKLYILFGLPYTVDYTKLNKRRREEEVEYSRTDAFIEKAVDYLFKNMRCGGYTLQTKVKFIRGFKNYMKGE